MVRILSTELWIRCLGGKNFHFVHSSAEINNAVFQTIRGAFEYSGEYICISLEI